MDERLRFVARLLDGEKMAPLCREFGISRKTGYKIFDRYKDCGLSGLTDRSRRPYRHANQLPFQVEKQIVALKQEHPGWGAPKIREKLRRLYPEVHCPAISTVHAVLDRHGLVEAPPPKAIQGRRHARSRGRLEPNELWCADYKGEFMLADQALLLSADGHRLRPAATCSPAKPCRPPADYSHFTVFERDLQGVRPAARDPHRQRRAVRHRPCPVRPQQPVGLVAAPGDSRSSASSPGIPQQNGRHERMHLTLKQEATKPASRQRPAAAGALRSPSSSSYNQERPHQALGMQCPPTSTRGHRALSRPPRTRPTRSTTRPSPSPTAAASASSGRRSISATSSRARTSA